jgi:hypothetical protein
MSQLDELDLFYTERVPAQFNRARAKQESAATGDEEQTRILDEMRAVRTAIGVQVETAEGPRSFAFDIECGVMNFVPTPEREPFLVLHHSLADFNPLRRECGDSILGFLGALAGLGDEMRLTAQRVRSLRELAGGLVFEITGASGFALLARFGATAPENEPRTRIRIDEKIFSSLRSGELDPQDAFLDGLVEVEGDMEMAIRLALAAASPD